MSAEDPTDYRALLIAYMRIVRHEESVVYVPDDGDTRFDCLSVEQWRALRAIKAEVMALPIAEHVETPGAVAYGPFDDYNAEYEASVYLE